MPEGARMSGHSTNVSVTGDVASGAIEIAAIVRMGWFPHRQAQEQRDQNPR